jgi:Raf kinase inhibitor-like YbhB/YbcL family protein
VNLLIIMSTIIQSTLNISSPAFEEGKMIPDQYTCDGRNVSPPLTISNLPDKTVSMVLIMDDPDAPGGGFVHWVMYNIPPAAAIKEDDAPGMQAANGRGNPLYTGPCPPTGIHHYHFKIYALDEKLDFAKDENVDKSKVQEKMKGHILASGELIGLYTKDNESLNKR